MPTTTWMVSPLGGEIFRAKKGGVQIVHTLLNSQLTELLVNPFTRFSR